MNPHMIRILIAKDLRLAALPALLYLAAGLAAAGMMAVGEPMWMHAGGILMISALMALGFHPVMATTVRERKDQTLAFVMSMPITPADYTLSKLAANMLLFFVPWTILLLACVKVIGSTPEIPDGLVPYSTILFGYLGASAVLILGVSVVSESMQLTIAAQICCNLGFQAIVYASSHDPVISATMYGEAAVWSSPVLAYASAFLCVSLLIVLASLWLQSRKRSFT